MGAIERRLPGENKKGVGHTSTPYMRKLEDIFGEDGGYSSLPPLLFVRDSRGTSVAASANRFPCLLGFAEDLPNIQGSDILGARPARSRHLPDLQALDEDVMRTWKSCSMTASTRRRAVANRFYSMMANSSPYKACLQEEFTA